MGGMFTIPKWVVYDILTTVFHSYHQLPTGGFSNHSQVLARVCSGTGNSGHTAIDKIQFAIQLVPSGLRLHGTFKRAEWE